MVKNILQNLKMYFVCSYMHMWDHIKPEANMEQVVSFPLLCGSWDLNSVFELIWFSLLISGIKHTSFIERARFVPSKWVPASRHLRTSSFVIYMISKALNIVWEFFFKLQLESRTTVQYGPLSWVCCQHPHCLVHRFKTQCLLSVVKGVSCLD